VDQILMAGIVSRGDLGIYVAAASWSTLAMPAFIGIGQLALPRLAAEHDPRRQRALVIRIVALAVGVAAAGAAVAIPLTPRLFPLILGDAVRPGAHVAQLLMVAGLLQGVFYVVEEVLRGLGRPVDVLVAEILGLITTIVMLTILLRPYGLRGAAFASITSYACTAAVLAGLIVRWSRRPPSTVAVARREEAVADEPEGDDDHSQPTREQQHGEADVHHGEDDENEARHHRSER
jgi:O-antigen/teichoic acid export membrane protein